MVIDVGQSIGKKNVQYCSEDECERVAVWTCTTCNLQCAACKTQSHPVSQEPKHQCVSLAEQRSKKDAIQRPAAEKRLSAKPAFIQAIVTLDDKLNERLEQRRQEESGRTISSGNIA
ncbi:MAG: hypothetical protein Q7T57_03895 [Dehalococcoidales bacterium]|nr:hypothetical protein [Dehalococcoidales bacterium]